MTPLHYASKYEAAIGGPLVLFCAGMIAETLACVIYVPVDVVKERF